MSKSPLFQDSYTYLLAHIPTIATKYSVPTYQPREEGVIWAFFPTLGQIQIPQHDHGAFVYERKGSEVASMLPRGFQNEPELFSEAAGSVSIVNAVHLVLVALTFRIEREISYCSGDTS